MLWYNIGLVPKALPPTNNTTTTSPHLGGECIKSSFHSNLAWPHLTRSGANFTLQAQSKGDINVPQSMWQH